MKNLDRYRPRIDPKLHKVMRIWAFIFIAITVMGLTLAAFGKPAIFGLVFSVVFFLAFWAKPKPGKADW